MPGGEEFYLQRGEEKGCLLIHGFTGSPSHMLPLGEALADEGVTVFGVRLAGHGTHISHLHSCKYHDWISSAEEGLHVLAKRCQRIYVAGLSMGGTLSLYLSWKHPERIKGVVSICAPLFFEDPKLRLIPLLKYFKKTWKKRGRGIKDPKVIEHAYHHLSLPGVHELLKICHRVKTNLPSILQRALIIAAKEDATVSLDNAHYMMEHLGSEERELFLLENSYHVATLDYDAPLLNQKTVDFIKEERT